MKKIIIFLFFINIYLIISPMFEDNVYSRNELTQNIILHRIEHSTYKTLNNGDYIGDDYDLFFIYHRKDLNFIKNLVNNKPESRFYALFNMTKENKKQTLQILSLLYMNDYQKEVEKYFNENNLDKAILKEICIPPLNQSLNKEFRESLKEVDLRQALEREWDSKECSNE